MNDALTNHISHLGLSDDVDIEPDDEVSPIQHEMETEVEVHPDDTEDAGTQTTEQQEEVIDYESEYKRIQNESAGRLATIGTLRENLRTTGDNIENLRKMVLEQSEAQKVTQEAQKAEQQVQKELDQYGEQVVNDPHVAYMRDKLNQITQQNEHEAQVREGRERQAREEHQRRMQFEEQRNQFLRVLKDQEESFSDEHPDYNDAYEFARSKRKEMYVRRGHDAAFAERAVTEEEAFLAQEQLTRGGSVPQEIYNWAKDYGWKNVPSPEAPGATTGESNEAQASVPAQEAGTGPSDFERIKRGLASASIRTLDGNAARHDNEYISAEQFYKTVPEHIRAQVHGDPDLFEQLGRYGKIKRFW